MERCKAAVKIPLKRALEAKDKEFLQHKNLFYILTKDNKQISYKNCCKNVKNIKNNFGLCNDHYKQKQRGNLIYLDDLIKENKSSIKCVNIPKDTLQSNLISVKQPIKIKLTKNIKDKLSKNIEPDIKIIIKEIINSNDKPIKKYNKENFFNSITDESSTDEGSNEESSDDESSNDKGSYDEGSNEEGSDEEGSNEEGSDDEGSNEESSDDEGSSEEGSDDEGSSEEGSDDEGSIEGDSKKRIFGNKNIGGKGIDTENISENNSSQQKFSRKSFTPKDIIKKNSSYHKIKLYISTDVKNYDRKIPLYYDEKTNVISDSNDKVIGILYEVKYTDAPIIYDGDFYTVINPYHKIKKCLLTDKLI